MSSSRSARRRRKLDYFARRKKELQLVKAKALRLPVCGRQAGSLWWLEGYPGLYEADEEGTEAFDLAERKIVKLARVEDEEAGRRLIQTEQERQMWEERRAEIPF